MKRAPPSPSIDLDVLSDLLGLVGRDAPAEVLKTWSPSQIKAAERWASMTHLRASDNPVRVPAEPPCVERLGFLRHEPFVSVKIRSLEIEIEGDDETIRRTLDGGATDDEVCALCGGNAITGHFPECSA